jgi:RNase adapter protein RapZ
MLPDALQKNAVLLVTGMSGAGKSTVLRALEDLGFEVVDNLPLGLLHRLLAVPDSKAGAAVARPLAIGIDTRTRAFDSTAVVSKIRSLRQEAELDVRMLFLDCTGDELTRRFSETRRRHPLALDRAASDGIAREREIMAPLRRWADIIVDTTNYSVNDLRRVIREKFARESDELLTLTLTSFGYGRGIPRDADLMFDLRFPITPRWQPELRQLTGLDPAVGDFIRTDPDFEPAISRVAELLISLIPRYRDEGKSYLTIAFGCTGGRHRSVFATEEMRRRLEAAGFTPAIVHRDVRADDDGRRESDELELQPRQQRASA